MSFKNNIIFKSCFIGLLASLISFNVYASDSFDDNDVAYADVLQFYKRASDQSWTSEDFSKYAVDFWVIYGINSMGYDYCDLNDDGIDELILGRASTDGNEEYAKVYINELYTLVDGVPKKISLPIYGDDSFFYYCDGHIINKEFVDGETYSLYTIDAETPKLDYAGAYEKTYRGDYPKWYYTDTDLQYAEFTPVSEGETINISDIENYHHFDFKHISSYPYADKSDVSLEYLYDGDYIGAVITGYDKNGKNVWRSITDTYQMDDSPQSEQMHPDTNGSMTGTMPIIKIGRYKDKFFYNENGKVIALDLETGEELWETEDEIGLMGNCSSVIDSDGLIYLSSPTGADLTILSSNGDLVWRIDDLGSSYGEPTSLSYSDTYHWVSIGYDNNSQYARVNITDCSSDTNPLICSSIPDKLGISIIKLCEDLNLDSLDASVSNPDVFWGVLSLYHSEDNPDGISNGGKLSGGYKMLDVDAVKELASSLFDDFTGELPSDSDYGFFSDKNNKCALLTTDSNWELFSTSEYQPCEDGTIKVEYILQQKDDPNIRVDYIVDYVPVATSDGQYQVSCVNKAELNNYGISDPTIVSEAFQQGLDVLADKDYAMDMYVLASANMEEGTYKQLVSCNLQMENHGTDKECGSGNVSTTTINLNGVPSLDSVIDFYYDDKGYYINSLYPSEAKVLMKELPIDQAILEYDGISYSDIVSCSKYNNTISISTNSDNIGIIDKVKSLFVGDYDIDCDWTSYRMILNRDGYPSKIVFSASFIISADSEEANCTLTQEIRFSDYNDVNIKKPSDLNEYRDASRSN